MVIFQLLKRVQVVSNEVLGKRTHLVADSTEAKLLGDLGGFAYSRRAQGGLDEAMLHKGVLDQSLCQNCGCDRIINYM